MYTNYDYGKDLIVSISFFLLISPLIYGIISLYNGIKSKKDSSYIVHDGILKNSDASITVGVICLIIQGIIFYYSINLVKELTDSNIFAFTFTFLMVGSAFLYHSSSAKESDSKKTSDLFIILGVISLVIGFIWFILWRFKTPIKELKNKSVKSI